MKMNDTLEVCPPPTIDDYLEPEINSGLSDFIPSAADIKPDEMKLFIGVLDLSQYTDADITNTARLYNDFEKKTVEVVFSDIRDYGVFVKLLKEWDNERRKWLKRILKKPKSIFITITACIGGERKVYEYEFLGCRIVDACDNMYSADILSEDTGVRHDCAVRFKYKKLKISEH